MRASIDRWTVYSEASRCGDVMKYVLLAVFLLTVAGIEFAHELSGDHASDVSMCVSPDAGKEAAREMLRHHLHSHH